MTLRLHLAVPSGPRSAGDELGGALFGRIRDGTSLGWPAQRLRAPLLDAPDQTAQESWHSLDQALTQGTGADLSWRRTAHVLFGVVELDEAGFAASGARTPLQAASEEVYGRIFRLLAEQKLPYLWRVWNYFADITGEATGLDRYRQFNVGRQRAFVVSQQNTTGNVPAASAIGLAEGPLSIAFMAGATPAVAVENPRQISAYDYPGHYGPCPPIFSRAVLAYPPGQEILFVSGTASIVGHQTVWAGDVARQCREAAANVAAVVAEANRRARAPSSSGLFYRVYVRHAADFPLLRDTLRPLLNGSAGTIHLQAELCRADLLLEIEAATVRDLNSA